MVFRHFVAAIAGAAALWAGAASAQVREIPWAASAVGSTGHRSLVTLAELLNKEMPNYRIMVQPTPGAIISVKGFATGQFEGYYGSDIAFYELANDTNRFKGFKSAVKVQPVQSFWTFTVEVGLAIAAKDQDKFKQWRDLTGQRVFTGPLPWDVRAHLERAMAALGVKHEYFEVDLNSVGSLLQAGNLKGFIVYTNAEAGTAPWITETSVGTDWAILNPSTEERQILKDKGFAMTEVKAATYKKDIHAPVAVELPFYYGYHVGLDIPADDVYRMLNVIEANAANLAKVDAGFAQVRDDMKGMQQKGVASSVEFVPVHPGLAKWMREKGVWDAKWDSRIAKPKT